MLVYFLETLEDESDKDYIIWLYNEFERLMYSTAFKYTTIPQIAEDIVQEVLIRLMQSAGVFEDESHEKAWLLKVASNLCKDKLKSASRQREVAMPEGYDVADEKQEKKEESDILQIISQLPEKYRSAIHLLLRRVLR